MTTALVLGGGIQGCCIALMLTRHGYKVNIIEKSNDIINRTSLNQEGKIHLGFVYGLDQSLKTGEKLLLDALYFAPYLEYLLGKRIDWDELKSTNFNYLVAKDSMLSTSRVEDYFQKLQSIYEEYLKNEKLTYLGKRPDKLFHKTNLPSQINHESFQACFSTEEAAVHQKTLKKIIKEKIRSENISLVLNERVLNNKKIGKGFIVETQSEDGSYRKFKSDFVINCLWEGKIALDKKMGMQVNGYNLRLKFGIIAKQTPTLNGLPSLTIIQGPYGDYVNYPQSKETYFCWYPSSMKGMIIDQKIPPSWEEVCKGNIPNTIRQELITENFYNFQRLIPKLPTFQVLEIKGGVILARGLHDIDERSSQLHERRDFPIYQKDGYFSVNTSKFTSAPRNTLLLENLLGFKQF